jgi:hypothetical protein
VLEAEELSIGPACVAPYGGCADRLLVAIWMEEPSNFFFFRGREFFLRVARLPETARARRRESKGARQTAGSTARWFRRKIATVGYAVLQGNRRIPPCEWMVGKVLLGARLFVLRLLGGWNGIGVSGNDQGARGLSRQGAQSESRIAEMEKRFHQRRRTIAKWPTPPHIVPSINAEEGGFFLLLQDYLRRCNPCRPDRTGFLNHCGGGQRSLGIGLLNGSPQYIELCNLYRGHQALTIFLVEGRALIGDFGIAHSPSRDSETS